MTVHMSLLSGNTLPVCIVQTLPVDIQVIAGDQARPAAVAGVRDLLAGETGAHPEIDDLVPNRPSTLVVLPEYALGSPDWSSIDAFVRQSPRPLVLVAGFGMTLGSWVLDWANQLEMPSPTSRLLGWNQGAQPISRTRRINGGWCWLHEPETGTTCVAFLKNVAEQTHEATTFPELQYGSSILHLSFSDVEIFPLLCADLLQPKTMGASTAQARIATALATPHNAKPALVVGCLLEKEPHNFNWGTAIADVVNHIPPNSRPLVLTLANQACAHLHATEDIDRWRSLSGVYIRRTDLPRGQPALPGGRPLTVGSVSGVVVRESSPCAIAGSIAWRPYGPVAGRFLWHTDIVLPLSAAGLQPAIPGHAHIQASELSRFTQRNPSDPTWSPRVADGLQRIRDHVATTLHPTAADLITSLLSGIARPELTLQPDELYAHAPHLKDGTYALAVLCTLDSAAWQGNPSLAGQLVCSLLDSHLLVWRDPNRSGRAIRRALEDWARQLAPHPRLTVLGHGASPIAEGPVVGDRRSDISESPQAAGNNDRDISSPRLSRSAFCVDLERVAHYYLDYDPDLDPTRFAELLQSLSNNTTTHQAA